MRYARPVVLEQKQRLILEQQARARSLEARVVERSRIVLLASEGKPDMEIGSELGISPKKAARWRNRFLDLGWKGLEKKDLYLICDNYATHKHPQVQRWLSRHKRFHVHFTPTSASWLNMVERFFRDLTQNQLKRGIFRDLEELIMAVEGYLDRHNQNPKPFIWTASARDILEKVTRARKAIEKVQSV
jgi:hypothetical protein